MKTKIIKQKIFITASSEEVYNAFVDVKIHSAFTGAKATGTAKEGSEFTAWDGYITGKHLKLVKGKKIVQEWTTTEWPKGAESSKLELTFTAKKDGTELTVVHSKVPAKQASDYSNGWKKFYWDPFKKYFSNKK